MKNRSCFSRTEPRDKLISKHSLPAWMVDLNETSQNVCLDAQIFHKLKFIIKVSFVFFFFLNRNISVELIHYVLIEGLPCVRYLGIGNIAGSKKDKHSDFTELTFC